MSKQQKIRIGILGCAHIASKYAIKAFQSLENAELVSIASRNPLKAKEWAERFGIEADDSYESLLLRQDIDAVYIPLPIGIHEEWILKAADAGKDIICEKSLSDSFESVQRIVDYCYARGVLLFENFACDVHPQHEKVISLVNTAAIGRVSTFRSYFGFELLEKDNIRYSKELGGGCLNDAGTYPVFMARKIFNAEPRAVTCVLEFDSATGVDVQGHAMLEFPADQTALVAFSFCSTYQNNYSLWGSTGTLHVDRAYSIAPDTQPMIKLAKIENYKDIITDISVPSANQFQEVFSRFCSMMLRKDEPAGKIEIESHHSTILAQAKVLQALRFSAAQGKRILLS